MNILINSFRDFIKQNIFYSIFFLLILSLAGIIYFNNIKNYNTWWADDGGAHIAYTETILNNHRLPTTEETYLAWHEPLYYLVLAAWVKAGQWLGINNLNWWESLNVLFYFIFLFSVWQLTYQYSQKNKWLALLNVFLFSILFTGVKLSAYVNNEILVHTLIILLAFLFYRWQLLVENKQKLVFWWSIILGLAALVKLTAFIILFAVVIVWFLNYIITQKKYFLIYILIGIIVVAIINTPWFIYKQNKFGDSFSINLHERQNKQNIVKSEGWQYLTRINYNIFTNNPYWFSQPHSFFSILLSDTFGDYYNLFNNVDQINNLEPERQILTGNGRYTTENIWQSMVRVNRVGLFLIAVWLIGICGLLFHRIKNRRIDWYEIFLFILLVGGCLAIVYNNLRFPYLERGVLKVAFIYFTLPILTIFSYGWWWQIIKNKFAWAFFVFGPIIVYLIIAWPILMV